MNPFRTPCAAVLLIVLAVIGSPAMGDSSATCDARQLASPSASTGSTPCIQAPDPCSVISMVPEGSAAICEPVAVAPMSQGIGEAICKLQETAASSFEDQFPGQEFPVTTCRGQTISWGNRTEECEKVGDGTVLATPIQCVWAWVDVSTTDSRLCGLENASLTEKCYLSYGMGGGSALLLGGAVDALTFGIPGACAWEPRAVGWNGCDTGLLTDHFIASPGTLGCSFTKATSYAYAALTAFVTGDCT